MRRSEGRWRSWATNRSRVRACRAEPEWIVVYPVTPDDSVSSNGSASRSRTSPTIATSGAMRRNPATRRRRSISGRSIRLGRVCMLATLATATSASKTSSAITTRRPGSSSAAQHDNKVVLPDPGDPAKTMLRRARTAARRKDAAAVESEPRSTNSSSRVIATPVNFRMFTIRWPPRLRSPWTMCSLAPSSSWASWRPSVGSSLRCDPDESSSNFVSVRATWSSSWNTSSWYRLPVE